MIFSECKLFRDIAIARNVSRGAASNGISQSAASQSLQELERRFGVTLLDRTVRPLALTAAGTLYLDLCRDVLRREEEFRVHLEKLKGAAEMEVRVASIYSVALTEMTRLRAEFLEHCPTVDLKVEYLRPDRVYESVLNGASDLGLVSYPESRRDLTVIPWRAEKMAVAVAPNHPLAVKPALFASELNGQRYVAFDEDLPIRRELDRYFRQEGVEVMVTMHFDNIQMIKEAVALGHGLSVLPDQTMQAEIEQRRLVAVPLNAPGLFRPVGVIHRRKKKLNQAARTFLEILTGQALELEEALL